MMAEDKRVRADIGLAVGNWQFVFQNMNKIPNNPHGCDFSRVKPWYLDNQ
jgi:hypothetical protein